jgi:hypothetical protein
VRRAAVATTVAAGVVRDSLGAPRAGARVTVEGVPGLEAVTGADGAFRLVGVPAGTQTLVVRALGYGPQPVTVGLRTAAPEPVDITLRRVTRLARVTVRDRARGNAALLAAVAQRRRLGLGLSLDSSFIRLSPQMEGVLRRVPYAMVHTVRGGVPGLFTVTNCPLAVAIDDRLTEWDEVADLPPNHVVAMEVYRRTTQVPSRFQGHLVQAARRVPIGGTLPCGLALLWTRSAR